MTFPAILLWFGSVAFVGFGVGFAVAPQDLAQFFLGASPTVPSAVIDMRAVYGGLSVGFGVFFGLCAGRPQWLRPGLVASLLAVAGLAAGRLVGIGADGAPNGFMLLFLATELLYVGLAVAALRQVRSARDVGGASPSMSRGPRSLAT